jgi:ubiquitin-conjugating enzyme E2 variant
MIVLEILGAWLLADFGSGIVHWAQDRLLNETSRFKFLNSIKDDNDLHHHRPGAMIQLTMWENINTTAPFTIPLSIILFAVGCPLVIWLAVFFASFANIIHRWAHIPLRSTNLVIKSMQATGLFISFEHHLRHHFNSHGLVRKEDTTGKYCPMTNWLNPILDGVGFFYLLERLVGKKKP